MNGVPLMIKIFWKELIEYDLNLSGFEITKIAYPVQSWIFDPEIVYKSSASSIIYAIRYSV